MAEDKIKELWESSTTARDFPEENVTTTIEALELEFKRERLEGERQNREQRKRYAKWLFSFICAYMIIALIILVLVGKECLTIHDSVLIAMLTTTTANVIGLFAIVARYLFYRRK